VRNHLLPPTLGWGLTPPELETFGFSNSLTLVPPKQDRVGEEITEILMKEIAIHSLSQ